MATNETRDFTIKVRMQARWIPTFLGMLRYMQNLGALGASRQVTFNSDGDGDFRPQFSWDIDVGPEVEGHDDGDGNRSYDAG